MVTCCLSETTAAVADDIVCETVRSRPVGVALTIDFRVDIRSSFHSGSSFVVHHRGHRFPQLDHFNFSQIGSANSCVSLLCTLCEFLQQNSNGLEHFFEAFIHDLFIFFSYLGVNATVD